MVVNELGMVEWSKCLESSESTLELNTALVRKATAGEGEGDM